jgi:hypothetical protein
MNTLEAVHIVCPKVLEMARRLEFAVHQLLSGTSRRDACRMVRERFNVSAPTAWRVVDMANDLVGK